MQTHDYTDYARVEGPQWQVMKNVHFPKRRTDGACKLRVDTRNGNVPVDDFAKERP
jgi:hypothetical protein